MAAPFLLARWSSSYRPARRLHGSTLPPLFVSLAIWQKGDTENSVDYLNFNYSLRILSISYRSVAFSGIGASRRMRRSPLIPFAFPSLRPQQERQ
jgi:hypothetical protein